MKPKFKIHSCFAPCKAGVTALIVTLAFAHSASAQTNTKTGQYSGNQVTSGKHNTSYGFASLQRTKNGSYNTALGSQALQLNIDGVNNTATGFGSMKFNASGSFNTATGSFSLFRNTSGKFNTATGREALFDCTTGSSNVAQGYQSLRKNKTGGFNVAIGDGALWSNTSGSSNIGIGEDAGYNLTTGSNNICIGNKGVAGQSGIIRLGDSANHSQTHIAGVIYGDGYGLTELNASNISYGTLSDSRLPSNIARRNQANTFAKVTGSEFLADFGTRGSVGIITPGGDPGIAIINGTGSSSHRWNIFTSDPGLGFGQTFNITDNATQAGVRLFAGTTAWSSVSDRNMKKNFEKVDYGQVLEKLKEVPILSWNYKSEADDDVPSIGPMAQDFKGAFFPGRDDKSISTLEFDGIELAAIRGLIEKLDSHESALEKKSIRISELEKQIEELKAADKLRDQKLVSIERMLRSSEGTGLRLVSTEQAAK